jgi:hypothetical protein
LWLPINVSRYMIMLQACNAFLVSYGIGWVAHNLLSKIQLNAPFRQRKVNVPSEPSAS